MSGLHLFAKMRIKPGFEASVTAAMDALATTVREKEPDTLFYGFYRSEESGCYYVQEHYKDAAAFVTHLENSPEELEALVEGTEVDSTTLLGQMSPELHDMLDGFGASDEGSVYDFANAAYIGK